MLAMRPDGLLIDSPPLTDRVLSEGPAYVVVAGAVVASSRVLATRRSYPAWAAGRWEFPGGKVDAGESPEEALRRELCEELSCSVRVIGWFPELARLPRGGVLLLAAVEVGEGEPTVSLGVHDQLRWAAADQLEDLDWLEPDLIFLPRLRMLLGEEPGDCVGGPP